MQKNDKEQTSIDIIIIDGLPPEEAAMSQALYSRKPKSILDHLKQVFKKGVGGTHNFINTWYSGYGHNSIGDCGSTTLYIENVSMLAAKAIQNHPLYSGQEASTRYLDFSGRVIINPLAGSLKAQYLYIPREQLADVYLDSIQKQFQTVSRSSQDDEPGKIGRTIQEAWMAFYETHMPLVKAHVASLNPKKSEQDQAQYDKAVGARAFDIMRAFIPAGMTTMLSWHSNIRQLRDHLAILEYHPSHEIQTIARTALTGLSATYPASFPKIIEEELSEKDRTRRIERNEYLQKYALHNSYYPPVKDGPDFEIDASNFNTMKLLTDSSNLNLILNRPQKMELPREIGRAGSINIRFKIDFGSFRDAQRHRKGSYRMPLLTTDYGFHPWYLERLPEESRFAAEKLIETLTAQIDTLPCSDVERQYYIPMGFRVMADFTWTFDQCVYVAELRSAETVHPTFRTHAQALGRWIKEVAPYTALYVDYSDDTWSYKRGSQDIIEKK